MLLPPMTVTFDDGTCIKVQAKPRDMATAERLGIDFTAGAGPMRATYAIALAALQRMQRLGEIGPGVEIPATVDELIDLADVEDLEDTTDPKG